MKKNIFLFIGLILMGIASMMLLQGCDKDETLTPQDFAPPTNLKALAKDGSVEISWTASTAAGVSEFAGYRVVLKSSALVTIDSIHLMTSTDTIFTGLTNGSTYNFSVRAVKSNGDVSTAITLEWGPTIRYITKRIYEFASSNPSGLQFSGGNTHSFDYDANAGFIDLWVDGRGGGDLLLKSPDAYDARPNWRTTKFFATSETSLDDQVDFPAASQFDTTALTISASKVYLAMTQDGNYARFQTSAVTGSVGNRYVDILIAYNTGTGHWAKK